MTTLDEIIRLERDTARIKAETAQIRMLTEIYKLVNAGGDTRSKLRQYIADKEKELGV